MEQVTAQLILDRIAEIGRKVDANTDATNKVVTANAVLTERVDNLIDRVDGHLKADDEIHEEQADAIADVNKKVASLDKWRTELKTKIATYAAVGAGAIAVVWEVGKEAVARILP